MKKNLYKTLSWLHRNDAAAVEDTTDRTAWFAITVVCIMLVAGVAGYFLYSGLNAAQTGSQNMLSSVSSQAGLANLAKNAETSTGVGIGTNSSGGYTQGSGYSFNPGGLGGTIGSSGN